MWRAWRSIEIRKKEGMRVCAWEKHRACWSIMHSFSKFTCDILYCSCISVLWKEQTCVCVWSTRAPRGADYHVLTHPYATGDMTYNNTVEGYCMCLCNIQMFAYIGLNLLHSGQKPTWCKSIHQFWWKKNLYYFYRGKHYPNLWPIRETWRLKMCLYFYLY